MRIGVICQYYYPEIGAPQARLSELSSVWVDNNCHVEVLTGFPNHPKGILSDEYKGKVKLSELGPGGEKIVRHWLYVTPNKGFVRKIISHLSFMFSIFLSFLDKKPDVYVVSSPTFFVVITTFLFSRLRRVPFIFEVRDLWPGIFIELGVLKNRFIISFLEAIELFLYRTATHVVVVTKGFKENLVERGISSDKISVIPNGVMLEKFSSAEECPELLALKKEYNIAEDDYVFLYIGAHGISQALKTILKACKEIGEERNFKVLFVGEGAEKDELVAFKEQQALDKVSFHRGVPREKAIQLYALADTVLVSLRDIQGFDSFIPSKIFEIMASKKPILAALRGESASIVIESEGGLVTPPEDSVALAGAMVKMIDLKSEKNEDYVLLGKNGYRYANEHYNRKKQALEYLEIFKRAIK